MIDRRVLVLFILVGSMAFLPNSTHAWSRDPGTNTPINVVSGSVELTDQATVPDGLGGFYLVWADKRSGDLDVFAQHLDSTGTVTWPANGVIVASVTKDQKFARAVSDGAGGIIVVWEDRRDGKSNKDIYAQRLDSSGSAKWTANGVLIKGDTNVSADPIVVADGVGGAVIFWEEGTDLYGQRIDVNGALQWAASGVAISNASGNQGNARAVSDSASGAFIAWEDTQNGNTDIYGQWVSSTATFSWASNGQAIVSASETQADPFLVRNPNGGAIFAWRDERNGTTLGKDIYVQWLNGAGSPVWASGGLPVVQTAGDQDPAGLVATGDGNYAIAWDDSRSGVARTYVQSFDQAGVMRWTTDGVAATSAGTVTQTTNALVPDFGAGVFVIFEDSRATTRDLYAQHLSAGGSLLWSAPGAAITTAQNDQTGAAATADGKGGFVALWVDKRSDLEGDLDAQQVNVSAELGVSTQTRLIVAAGPGGGPRVNVYDRTGKKVMSFLAYDSSFRGGVRVATGDLDGDGVDEIIATPISKGNELRIFTADGKLRAKSKPFGRAFSGGLNVALGDVNGDAIADLVVVPSTAGPEPRVMALKFTGTGLTRIKTFLAFPTTMTNGLEILLADVRDDGNLEIIAAAHGPGPALVRIFSRTGSLKAKFTAYDPRYTGGALPSSIDLTGDGKAEVLVSPAAALTPEIRFFSGTGKRIKALKVFSSTPKRGVHAATGDFTADGTPEIAVAPVTPATALVRLFTASGTKLTEFTAFPSSLKLGVRLTLGDVTGDGLPELSASLNPGSAAAVRVFTYSAGRFTQYVEIKPFGSFKGGATAAVGRF